MQKALKTPLPITRDRPGWIPPEIADNWDPNPYAYQTEEELMPAGGLHGYLLTYVVELLRHGLEARGLMLLADIFLLYRDESGIKKRIGPDLLLMPFRFPPPSAYDLDDEPPPLVVVELTSPRSRLTDLENKATFYLGLGIPTYLVIDAVTPGGRLRQQVALHLWRAVEGQPQKIQPDAQEGALLPEMGLKIVAQGQRIRFVDVNTGEFLLDAGQLLAALREAEARAEAEARRAEAEAEARQAAEAEVARLKALLARKD